MTVWYWYVCHSKFNSYQINFKVIFLIQATNLYMINLNYIDCWLFVVFAYWHIKANNFQSIILKQLWTKLYLHYPLSLCWALSMEKNEGFINYMNSCDNLWIICKVCLISDFFSKQIICQCCAVLLVVREKPMLTLIIMKHLEDRLY